ncbi:hypothetical protein HY256_06085 [Candidatus Sumerlaeota bacterium]|nr:hypothetical protein [Candidatus Sumerlaeota bacterium]
MRFRIHIRSSLSRAAICMPLIALAIPMNAIAAREGSAESRKAHVSFKGNAVDAETGAPIKHFTILTGAEDGTRSRNPFIGWNWDHPVAGTNGSYSAPITYYYPSGDYPNFRHYVRIEAEGYIPQISPPAGRDSGANTADFRLKRGRGPRGIVKKPDGSPAAGAQVMLHLPYFFAQLVDGRFDAQGGSDARRRGLLKESDTEGKFEFAPQCDPFVVGIAGEGGWAEVRDAEFTSDTQITLTPWGRIEGIVTHGGVPMSGKKMFLYPGRPYNPDTSQPQILYRYETRTADGGKYAFDHVIPFDASIACCAEGDLDPVGRQTYKPIYNAMAEVRPGETIAVNLGDCPSRALTGTLVLPDGMDGNLLGGTQTCWVRGKPPDPEIPEEVRMKGYQAIAEWIDGPWRLTPEGKTYRRAINAGSNWPFNVKSLDLDSAGAFRLEAVAEGSYELLGWVTESAAASTARCHFGAKIRHRFNVPPVTEENRRTPLNLGTLKMDSVPCLIVGETIPEFRERWLGGKIFRASDLRGLFTLIVLWNDTDPTIAEQIPALNSLFVQFKNEKRFIMIGVNPNLATGVDQSAALLAKRGIEWPQCYPDWGTDDDIGQFYPAGMKQPANLFIGNDGILRAKDTPTAELEALIRRCLSN